MVDISPAVFSGACHAAINNEMAVMPDFFSDFYALGEDAVYWQNLQSDLKQNWALTPPSLGIEEYKPFTINSKLCGIYVVALVTTSSVYQYTRLEAWFPSATPVTTDLTQLTIKNENGVATYLESAKSASGTVGAGPGYNGFYWEWTNGGVNDYLVDKINVISIT